MTNTIEYYLSKGFDLKYAEYFANGRRTIIKVTPNDDFTLTIVFDNNEVRIFDMNPMLKPNTVFELFMNLDEFRRVYLDDTHSICWDIDPNIDSNITWNNKVDLSPDACYVDSIPVEVYDE